MQCSKYKHYFMPQFYVMSLLNSSNHLNSTTIGERLRAARKTCGRPHAICCARVGCVPFIFVGAAATVTRDFIFGAPSQCSATAYIRHS